MLKEFRDRVARLARLVGDPVAHPEVDQARSIFRGVRLGDRSGARVLIISQRSWASQTSVEATLAAALSLRDANVRLLTCGGDLPACEMGRPRHETPSPCRDCAGYQGDFLHSLEIPCSTLRDFVTGEERSAIEEAALAAVVADTFEWDGLPIGQLVRPAVAWSLRDQRIGAFPDDGVLHREFLASGATVAVATRRLLEDFRPEIVVALNGTFMEERILVAQARRFATRVITYEAGPRENTWFFSEGAPACEYDVNALWSLSAEAVLNEVQERELQDLLEGRESGVGVHAGKWVRRDRDSVRAAVGVRPDQRLVVVFTNVGWDTGAFERGVAFSDDLEFVEEILRIAARSRHQFVLRVHPGETALRARRPLVSALENRLSPLPNVHVIGPDDPFSSYALLDAAETVIVYSSTIGAEAAARGHPVIVGGRTHYRGKGFTWDVESRDDLSRWIEDEPPVMTPLKRRLARTYAYTFFFRGLVPFPPVTIDWPGVRLAYDSVEDLLPGHDQFVDLVCDGILYPGRPLSLGPL
jgi:hypothetical protein